MPFHHFSQPFVFAEPRFDQLRVRVEIEEVFDPRKQRRQMPGE